MFSRKVKLNSIENVKKFVNTTTKFPIDFDLSSDRYIIDGKSIMGIFSIDLSKVLKLTIHADENSKEGKSVDNALKEFYV